MKGLNIATGVAVGVGLLFTGFEQLQKATTEALPSLEATARALDDLYKHGDRGGLDAMFKVDSSVFASIDSMQEAVEQLNKFRTDAVFRFGEWGNSLLPGTSEYEQALQIFKQLDTVLAGMNPDQAAEYFKRLSEELYASKMSAGDMVEQFPRLAESAKQLAHSVDFDWEANGGVRTLVKIMQGELPDAMRESLEATEEGREALKQYGIEAGKSVMSLEELAKAQRDSASAALTLSGAMMDYEESVDVANKKIAENGKGLDINTAKGRANRKALDDIASEALKVADAMEKAGESTEDVSKFQEKAAAEFLKAAEAAGLNAREAAELALEYGLIPKKVTTEMLAKGDKATKKEIDKFNRDLKKIPKERRAEILSVFFDKGVKTAQRELNKVKSKTVNLNIQPRYLTPTGKPPAMGKSAYYDFGYADGGMVQHLADGGFSSPGNGSLRVTGGNVQGSSPHPRADNIPTMLTAREFVHPVKAVDKYGGAFMEAVRTGRFPAELAAVGLADGGRPDGWQRSRETPVAVSSPSVARSERPIEQTIVATQVNPHALLMAAGQRLGGL